jgi:ketosteroid isomerase-like protein
MRKLLLALVLSTILPVSAIAGPKEDAFKVIEQFKIAFDSADVPGVVKLFAPDAVFLGTVSPKLATKTAEIDTYFQGIKVDTPRKVEFGDFSTMVISDTAVAFAGMDTFLKHSRWKNNRASRSLHLPCDERRPGLEHQTFPLVLAAGTMTICDFHPVQATMMACIPRNPNLLAGGRA